MASNCRGPYDLIVVGTQESASVGKRGEEALEYDLSLPSSPGPPSPRFPQEAAYFESAAPGKGPPFLSPAPVGMPQGMRSLSPGSSSSGPVASQQPPSYPHRVRGHSSQRMSSALAPGAPPGVPLCTNGHCIFSCHDSFQKVAPTTLLRCKALLLALAS
jgi:hypothetical protein